VKKYWSEFVAFIMTGNVLMLAVAFVMGGLTKTVIDSFVNNIINPIIGAIVGKSSFSNTLTIGKGVIQYGAFITTVINLVITGAVLFLIVKAYDAYRERKKASGEDVDEPNEEIVLLRRIATVLESRPA
jgi:large conductance mechanosensitive channel